MIVKSSAWQVPWSDPRIDLQAYPALATARTFSVETLSTLAALAAPLARLPGLVTLATAGSLGRLEAMSDSDCDLIVIVDDALSPGSEEASAVLESVWDALSPRGLKRPKNWGIFTVPASVASLTDPNDLGALDDDPTDYGKRMQLLLDSQPIFGARAFDALQLALLRWFMTGAAAREPAFPFAHLLGELMRYYRTYVSWQHFKLTVEDDENWCVRQAKLASSRRLMVISAQLAIMAAASAAEPLAYLQAALRLPPLARLAHVTPPAQQTLLVAVFEHYEAFQQVLGTSAGRAALLSGGPVAQTHLDAPQAVSAAIWPDLVFHGQALGDALVGLVQSALCRAPAPVVRSLLV